MSSDYVGTQSHTDCPWKEESDPIADLIHEIKEARKQCDYAALEERIMRDHLQTAVRQNIGAHHRLSRAWNALQAKLYE
jgi:hypothetical protein